MCDRYAGYLYGGTPVSSWDRGFNMFENVSNQIQQQYTRRSGPPRFWGSMSEGGGISSAGGDTAKTNLIVNYLPQSMTEKDLYAMFMAIGPIESCRVMKDFKTGYSYGFGFVNFTREEDAARAIDTFNGYQLRNKRLKVSYARPSGDDIKETNLYVTNLPRAINEEQLETIFGKYGRIVQKHILRDKNNGTPRGVAFVRFDKREEAQEAIAALNNVIPEGGSEPLSVKVAEEHGKQKAAYYAGWTAGFHQNRGYTPQRHHSLDQLDSLHRLEYPTNYGMYPNTSTNLNNMSSLNNRFKWDRLGPMSTTTTPWYSRSGDDKLVPVVPSTSQEIKNLDISPLLQEPCSHTNKYGDYAWDCGNCIPEPWDHFPLGGSQPPTPRNGCRPNFPNRIPYPNYLPGKGPRPNRGRNSHWPVGFSEERFKGQRCRNGPSPYW